MFNSISQYLKHTDKYLLFLSLACSAYGLILVSSATASYDSTSFVTVQSLAMLIGLIAYIIVSIIDVDHFKGSWKLFFILNILLQMSLFLFGVGGESTGNNSWIRFGPIGIQPGEIGKVIFVFTFAMHISLLRNKMNDFRHLFKLLAHAGITFLAVMVTSGDLGVALSYVIITGVMLFIAGLSYKWFAGAFISLLALIPIVWNFVLKNYHKDRILVIFDPSLNPDIAYQSIQSKIAIGSGGVAGNGYMEGTLNQFGRLPAKHTDFIFAVASEEFGFIGSMLIVVLLALLVARVFYVCFKAPTVFSALICAGIGGMLLYQIIQNILMCLGVLPVIGITLPFFSYGGTSIVTMYVSIGVVAGIRMREKPSHLKL